MKKLVKLQINPEKLMNDDELLTLKGGYDGCANFLCMCYGTGVWQSCYCSPEAMAQDIESNCPLGGSCSQFGNC